MLGIFTYSMSAIYDLFVGEDILLGKLVLFFYVESGFKSSVGTLSFYAFVYLLEEVYAFEAFVLLLSLIDSLD